MLLNLVHNTFEVMQSPLRRRIDLDEGRIYMFREPDRPENLKTGRTNNNISAQRYKTDV